MHLDLLVALVALAALIAYALLGGADFGGGVWDLFARGPRGPERREAIARAMGPVWEANHVWLIFLIVLLFTAFPPAFAALSTHLFIPFHLVLVGIVLRGSAFVFRAHGATVERIDPFWTRVFGVASVVTPFLLGMCLGAVSSGAIEHPAGWWRSPLSWSLGALSLAICAYLAAVYLTLETEGRVREDFRREALRAGLATALFAGATLIVAAGEAPRLFRALSAPRALPLVAAGVLLALGSTWALVRRRYTWARAAAAAEVVCLVLGWALAQYPYLIYPTHPIQASAAPPATLAFLLASLGPGALILIPSLCLLFRVFKGQNPAPAPEVSPER